MKKLLLILAIALFAWLGTVIADREILSRELINVHILADSNDPQAQRLKLEVRDSVMKYLEEHISKISDRDVAGEFLLKNLDKINDLTDSLVKKAGFELAAQVSLVQEPYPAEKCGGYDIPSGVYETLSIVIGKGQGENCREIAFPNQNIHTVFSRELMTVLSGTGELLRFYILCFMGMIENFFYS